MNFDSIHPHERLNPLPQLQRAIFVYSMVDNNPRIRTALSLLDLENEHILAHFSSCHEEIIFATLDAMGLSEMYKYKLNNYYVCPVDRAARLSYKIPDNVVLQPLNLSHADQIIRYISFKSPMSDQLVRQAISFAPSLGAFCRFSGELMAWCLSYLNEAHSALAVRDEFQGRGLAKLLVRKIAHDRAVIEHKPSHCHIADGRAASEHVFKDAGFEIIATCYFGGKDGIIG